MQQLFSTPLCVDLDGTLIKTNTLFEAFLVAIKRNPLRFISLFFATFRGKTYTKHIIGQYAKHESFVWLYNNEFLTYIQTEHAKGRILILATASDIAIANKVASELGIFQEVIASSITTPVNASTKYKVLEERFGNQGFSYAGNSHADIAVWNISSSAIFVHTPKAIASLVKKSIPIEAKFPVTKHLTLSDVVQEIRIHQWLKNLLLFVPLIMAHQIGDGKLTLHALVGFFSFSLLASSMYVMNDLLDIPSDRAHKTKRTRPIALGTISALQAIFLAGFLGITSFALALAVLPFSFFQMLVLYICINGIYSFRAKKIPYVDISILTALYVLRIFAGSAATIVPTSTWLFLFAGCLFFFLACMKRVIELLQLQKAQDTAPGRGYSKQDTKRLVTLGISSSFLSCIVLGLYIRSNNVTLLYSRPELLWALLPLLGIWIIRMWHLTLTKRLPDDPVLFTSKDSVSYGIGAAVIGILLLATL
ncbi:MAG: UbiA family prenyltransferase [bacterium]|nr:UbiA family prenyltransferase [bacterium]